MPPSNFRTHAAFVKRRCAAQFSQQSHAIHTASHQEGKKHTRCLTSYLDAVSVGCVQDSRNQVFGRLPVVVGHPGRIPGQDQDPWSPHSREKMAKGWLRCAYVYSTPLGSEIGPGTVGGARCRRQSSEVLVHIKTMCDENTCTAKSCGSM